MPVRAVVFDLFDTLVDLSLPRLDVEEVDGRPVHATAHRLHAALGEAGAGIAFEELARALRRVDESWVLPRMKEGVECPTLERMTRVAALLGIEDPDAAARLTAAHMATIREHVTTPPHHAAALAALAARVPLGLCSNFTHAATAHALLAESGLGAHLGAVVISEAVGFRKPRPEIFARVVDALGLAPGEILHVGDDLAADVGGAAAAGMRTAWLTRRVRDPGAKRAGWQGPAPDHVVTDVAELAALLG